MPGSGKKGENRIFFGDGSTPSTNSGSFVILSRFDFLAAGFVFEPAFWLYGKPSVRIVDSLNYSWFPHIRGDIYSIFVYVDAMFCQTRSANTSQLILALRFQLSHVLSLSCVR